MPSYTKTAVLLMSLGSPENLDDMEKYLLEIRNGHPPSPELVEEIKKRYQAAGGRSPLLGITLRQAKALEERLRQHGHSFNVYVGMRHWHPFIEDVMKTIVEDQSQRLVSLPLTPYYSKMSVETYHAKVRKTAEKLDGGLQVIYVNSWNSHPYLLASFAELISQTFLKFSPAKPDEITLLFTAHSLPSRILDEQDPYQDQFLETAQMLAEKLQLSRWTYAYQSQGARREPWLGPTVEEAFNQIIKQGHNKVLLAPIGFVCDHMEILYDVDIHFQQLAQEKGIQLIRTPSPNDSPLFIEALENVVLDNLSAFLT